MFPGCGPAYGRAMSRNATHARPRSHREERTLDLAYLLESRLRARRSSRAIRAAKSLRGPGVQGTRPSRASLLRSNAALTIGKCSSGATPKGEGTAKNTLCASMCALRPHLRLKLLRLADSDTSSSPTNLRCEAAEVVRRSLLSAEVRLLTKAVGEGGRGSKLRAASVGMPAFATHNNKKRRPRSASLHVRRVIPGGSGCRQPVRPLLSIPSTRGRRLSSTP